MNNKIKKVSNFIYKTIVLISLGLVILLLILNLVTPDATKRKYKYQLNSFWDNNKPQIVAVFPKYDCTKHLENPNYQSYYKNADMMCFKSVNGKTTLLNDEYKECLNESLLDAPERYIQKQEKCSDFDNPDKYFFVFSIKLFKFN